MHALRVSYLLKEIPAPPKICPSMCKKQNIFLWGHSTPLCQAVEKITENRTVRRLYLLGKRMSDLLGMERKPNHFRNLDQRAEKPSHGGRIECTQVCTVHVQVLVLFSSVTDWGLGSGRRRPFTFLSVPN